jgi:uncharacterized protein HemX
MFNFIAVDWGKVSEAGIGVVALVAIVALVWGLGKGFLAVWGRSIDSQEKSTDAISKNTEAYNKLSVVFEKSYEREIEFQKEAIQLLRDNHNIAVDTQKRVKDIHDKIKE